MRHVTLFCSVTTAFSEGRSRRLAGAILAACGALALAPAGAWAADHQWTGPQGGAWSSNANWSGGAPTVNEVGATVTLPQGSTSTMDIPGLSLDGLVLSGDNVTLNGGSGTGPLHVGSITSTGANDVIAAPLAPAQGLLHVHPNAPSAFLKISGAISGDATDQLWFTASQAAASPSEVGVVLTGKNTFAGAATVFQGTLRLDNSGFDVGFVGSSITVGDPQKVGAFLELGQSSQIGDTTDVVLASRGVLDLGSANDE
ncbi:MAG: hypothetical protein AAGC46_20870, partial [Solirubrobacteraceae bacterium]